MAMPLSNKIQLSYTDQGKSLDSNYLVVLAKFTYSLREDGSCILADHQQPLSGEQIYEPEDSENLVQDVDLFPVKLKTDLIIKGSARSYGAGTSAIASVQLEGHKPFSIFVVGNRFAYLDQNGNLNFSKPEPFEEIKLSFSNAYGGADLMAEKELKPTPGEFIKAFPDTNFDYSSVYRYPRNSEGKGYKVIPLQKDEKIPLPNLEDPTHLITPLNFCLGDFQRWINQPMPMATGWMDYPWFPRLLHFGIMPFDGLVKLEQEPWEFRNGVLTQEQIVNVKFEDSSLLATNGAHPGLQFPYLRGDEQILLRNIHPQHKEFIVRLPGDRPRLWTDGRKGSYNPASPVIHTVMLNLEENLVTILWRGMSKASRPYLPEELENMPFKVEL